VNTSVFRDILPSIQPGNSAWLIEKGKQMVGDFIVRTFVAIYYLLESLVVGVVRFVVALLGPGLTVLLIVLVAVLWWFGWLPF
jgi:hypothetical protein